MNWQEAVIAYCSVLKKKPVIEQLRSTPADSIDDKQILVLKLLVILLISKGSTFEKFFPLMYSEYDASNSINTLPKTNYNYRRYLLH
jgi:hypothetical protein